MLTKLIIILIAEYVGDFLLQSRHTALNKSQDIKILFKHLSQIGAMLIVPLVFMMPIYNALLFVGLYCLVHGVQDWYIWNGYKYLVYNRFKKKLGTISKEGEKFCLNRSLDKFKKNKEYAEDKVFYDTIGLDRLLHIITLVILCGVFL